MLTQDYLQYPKYNLSPTFASNELNFWKSLLRDCLKFIGDSGFNMDALAPTDQLLVCKKAPKHLKPDQATLYTNVYLIS